MNNKSLTPSLSIPVWHILTTATTILFACSHHLLANPVITNEPDVPNSQPVLYWENPHKQISFTQSIQQIKRKYNIRIPNPSSLISGRTYSSCLKTYVLLCIYLVIQSGLKLLFPRYRRLQGWITLVLKSKLTCFCEMFFQDQEVFQPPISSSRMRERLKGSIGFEL